MQVIPLIQTPDQSLEISLDGQACLIRLKQQGDCLFMDLSVFGESSLAPVFTGQLCRNRVNLKPFAYMPFRGGLYFMDMQSFENPHYSGLGPQESARFLLLFVAEGDTIPAGFRG